MRFQLIISIIAAAIPLVAFLLMLPRKKKKSKKNTDKAQDKEKKVEPVLNEKDANAANVKKSYEDYKQSLDEDFKRYAKDKNKIVTGPGRKISVGDSKPTDFSFSRRDDSDDVRYESKKTVIDEFNETSDELKTLIISGLLDKKDYEN